MSQLSFRQVHLDFHTSEHMKQIGKEFDKKAFQEALRCGYVDSITLFSKCHHGWSYHPTKVNQMHPNLTFDLLQEELNACKEIEVKSPVYISAGLDEKEAVVHPEWISRLKDETTTWVKDFTSQAGFHLLCFNTGYMILLQKQIEEVMIQYKPSGIFLDIAAVHPCYCSKCRGDILKRGKDPRDDEAVIEQAELVYQTYTSIVEETVRKYSKTTTIFHNGGHITRGRRDLAYHNTHLELESLPTGGWGYDHFPMSAAYVANLGMEYLGMTGKFHNTWGEFGGYKHPNALRYETGLSLSFGAKCSIGDQMHPLGLLDKGTYELIGAAYKEVKEKEEWCKDSSLCYDIGILSQEAMDMQSSNRDEKRWGDIGANRIMLEGNYLYRFVDQEEDFNRYSLLILPDTIQLDDTMQKRLQIYLDQGGKILATGKSGLDEKGKGFALDFGAEFLGETKYRPDYLTPNFSFCTGSAAHIMYEQGYQIKLTHATLLGSRENPYFNRDVYQFSSHQHTPNNPDSKSPAIALTSNTAYIAWNVFTDYAKMGALHVKETILFLLDRLLGNQKTIEVALPDRGVTTLMWNQEKSCYINHLLFAHTTMRGSFFWDGVERPIEVIESIVALSDVFVKLRVKQNVKEVYLAPHKIPISYQSQDGFITYTVPKVDCHQMVVIEVEE